MADWTIEQGIESLDRLRNALEQSVYGMEVRLRARVKKIGNDGWLTLNVSDGVQEALADSLIADLLRKIPEVPDVVRFVDDAWQNGRISITHEDDEQGLDDKLYEPLFWEDVPSYDGSEYVTKNLHVKATKMSSDQDDADFVAYGRTGADIFVRRKYFQFNEQRFEQLAGHETMVKQRAEAAVQALIEVEGVGFASLDDVYGALKKTEFARKLAAAHSQGVFQDLTPARLQHDIATNGLHLDFEIRDDIMILSPDLGSRESRREFVDLLVESLYVSRSGRKYRALQKQPRD